MSKMKISKSDVLSLHYFGKTNSEIAEIAGVSTSRIWQIINGYYKHDQNITMTAKEPERSPSSILGSPINLKRRSLLPL